jgi:hypothetical protein
MTHEFQADFCAEDVHGAFGLSYASYLVVRRSLLQEMPAEWQHRLVELMDQFHEAFPEGDAEFAVFLRDPATRRFARDCLRDYRHPDPLAIARARGAVE